MSHPRPVQSVTKSMQSDLIMQPIAKNSSKNFNNSGFLTYFEEL
jgi:hypothetical protein